MTTTKNHDEIRDDLNALIKCSHCGALIPSDEILDVDGANWCKDCAESADDVFFCDHCEEWHRGYPYDVEGETWCESCTEQDAYFCDRCEEWTTTPLTAVRVGWRDFESWCDECVDMHAVQCDDCGDYFANSSDSAGNEVYVHNDGYRYLCCDCQENYRVCEDCGDFVSEDDVEYHDGYAYCPNCAHHHGALQSYGHTDGMTFWDWRDGNRTTVAAPRWYNGVDKRLFLGIELETDYNDDAWELANDITERYNESTIECKQDGSLHDNGVEIVSQPMTPLCHLNSGMWEEIAGIVREHGGTSHDAGSCGLHIHLSRTALAEDTPYRLDRLFHRFMTKMLRFSRRNNTYYCTLEDDGLSEIESCDERKTKWKNAYRSRYVAVNTLPSSTVEIRLWRGTLNMQTFRATVEFTTGLVYVCNAISDEAVETISWRELLSLIRYQLTTHGIPYDDLDGYLNTRGL